MSKDNSKGLEALLKFFDASRVISPEDVDAVLKGITSVLSNFRDETQGLNTDTKAQLESFLSEAKKGLEETLSTVNDKVDTHSKTLTSTFESKMTEIKDLIEVVKATIPLDGKDGETPDINEIAKLVLEQIQLPEQKDVILDDAGQIRDKLQTLKKDDRLDISAIKGADKLKDEIVHHATDQARGILYAGLLENQSNGGGGTGSGAQGATGPQGPQGTQGSQGSAGNDGAQGATGAQGVQGTQGSIGLQGATGNNGADGARGSQGSQGSAGAQGSTGNQGTQGSIGIQGPQGTQGTLGPTGATGAQGVQGTMGSRGSQGSQGTQGTLGPTGATGPQGAQGTQGSQGTIGVQGPQGTQGSIGATGGTGFVTPRSTATGSTLSPTPNADTTDVYALTLQSGTAAFQATSGTPVEGQKLIIKIRGTGPTQNITWTGGTGGYTAGGVALPTTTNSFKVITVGFIYDTSNSINRWMCVAVATQV